MEAAFTGHADQLKTLLAQDKCSGKVTAPDEAGMGPIHLCALRGQVECATILLDVEPNSLHAADTRGRTPPNRACSIHLRWYASGPEEADPLIDSELERTYIE